MSNQSNINYHPAIANKRVEASHTVEIASTPQKIFPLACPVEELRWIPGWEYEMIYTKSGINEKGCIFTENKSGPHFFDKSLTTTWVTNLHDAEKTRIVFQLNLADKAVIHLQVNIQEVGTNISSCNWHMIYTALDREANEMDENAIKEKLDLVMIMLATALKHYCETGEMIK